MLAREFGDWATERIRVELGIVIPPDEDHPTGVLEEVLASGGRVYVAEVDGDAVGVGGLKLLSTTTGEIKRMFVRPTARGLGAGRAIVQQLIDDARELGARRSTSRARRSCTTPIPSTGASGSCRALRTLDVSSRAPRTISLSSCGST